MFATKLHLHSLGKLETTGDAVELTLNFIEKCKVNVIGKLKPSEGIPAIFVKNSSKVYTRLV